MPALVQNSFQGTFGFNYGIANRLVLGLNVPVILMTGDPAYDIGRGGPGKTRALLDRLSL